MNTEAEHKLTQYSKGGGCGCKIAPDVLQKIIAGTKNNTAYEKLLVGNHSNDDAAVYDIGNGTTLISTTDFFTPMLDDAFDFGRVAATNAISDVYAMGGKPIYALAVMGFPIEKLPLSIASKILEGALNICNAAGIPLAGGHTIESSELFFGLSVNGIANINHIKKNNTAQPGDVLFLTKPLGIGILSAAHKKGAICKEDFELLIKWMTTLNSIGEILGREECVTSMTDVTGFGLAGHLLEVCKGSNVTAHLNFDKIPFITSLDKYLDRFIYPDLTTKTFSAINNDMTELNAKQLFTLCDPQTSGGLLVCVKASSQKKIEELFASHQLPTELLQPIGMMMEKKEKFIEVC
jgi:selenide, water dikinase